LDLINIDLRCTEPWI